METVDPNVAASIIALSSSDLTGIGAILSVLLLVIVPFVVKFWNWAKETSAQGMLYSQLSEVVQKQRVELDAMYIARNTQQEQIFELRHKVEQLESCEKTVDILKLKLDQKDQIIAERDIRIATLLEELLKMKDRVHNLELRLQQDEAKFCEGCQYKEKQVTAGE